MNYGKVLLIMEEKKFIGIVFFGLLGFIVLACAPKTVVAPPLAEKPDKVEKSTGKADWEMEWDKTSALAKKENNLVIYSDMPPAAREVWIKNFGEKFGVDIQFVSGRGAETSQKLLAERRVGIKQADLFISGLTTLYLVVQPTGALEPFDKQLFLPEVIDPKGWYDGRLPWFTEEHLIFLWRLSPTPAIAINTQLIKPGEIKSHRDLLKPQWKGGKFLLNDPTVAGAGSKWFEVYSREEFLGVDYMKSLVRQEPVVIRDYRLATEWVARGRYPLSVAVPETYYEPVISAGAPVKFIRVKEPEYLTSGGANLAWVEGSPHPSAAKLFANWLFGREGQALTQPAIRAQSSREDIGLAGMEGTRIREEGVKYYNANTEENYKKLAPLKQLAKEIFSSLVK